MKIMLRVSHKKRSIVITHVWHDPINKAWIVCVPKERPFNKLGSYRLTNVLYWLYTGKTVRRGQLIHHVDGDPLHNLFENLELSTRSKHARQHHIGRKVTEATRRQMSKSALAWSRLPENRKATSLRAKRQHKQKNFGAHTWKRNHKLIMQAYQIRRKHGKNK